MEFEKFLLTIAAILPGILLCIYIDKKDRVEKEPLSVLVPLLIIGALSCFPAGFAEGIVIGAIDNLFGHNVIAYEGSVGTMIDGYYLYNFLKYFIGVALIEEGAKWLVLKYGSYKNCEFDSLFDGIVYASFASLGFAIHENILYALKYGWITALGRAFLSVPAHAFFGIIMGYYYSMWYIHKKANEAEILLQKNGVIPADVKKYRYNKYMWLCILVPVFYHGAYDFCCSVNNVFTVSGFYAMVIFLYIYCFCKVRKISRADNLFRNYVHKMLNLKYPYLADVVADEEAVLLVVDD
ncbi:MAG: PrsW family intramembrane metalloprotease [Clostridia bacterium]|nr:PrsW family intramembrane metalloprotease [Clostridia bacterium]